MCLSYQLPLPDCDIWIFGLLFRTLARERDRQREGETKIDSETETER